MTHCEFVASSDEGTAYCVLSQINASELEQLRRVVGVMRSAKVRFGRPTVVGTGIPTYALVDRFLGGDSIADLVADYNITTEQVETALRYELGRKRSDRL